MEFSYEGVIGKDFLLLWWGLGCGSRFYRYVYGYFWFRLLVEDF